MELETDSPVPLYLQIAGELEARIERRQITRRLPSIVDITAEFTARHSGRLPSPVSRETAHKALKHLAAEGVAVVGPNRGYWVNPENYPANYKSATAHDGTGVLRLGSISGEFLSLVN